jgi:GNAT superfamily N-acetyltransferase
MNIRDAVVSDAVEACTVLRRSISELCFPDHQGDQSVLARWLANKTPEKVNSWIAQADCSLLLAVEYGKILAVGAVTDAGEITLNYVSPDARFQGVSKAMLLALENRAAERGNTQCTLESSETARRFYLSAGYRETGPPVIMFGSPGYPMFRSLSMRNS